MRLHGKLSAPAPAAAAQRLYAQQLNTHECARAVCPLETEAEADLTEAEIQTTPELHLAAAAGPAAAPDPRRARTPTADAAAALSSGMLLAAVCCSLLVGAAAGGGAVHWAELRRRAHARAASSDGACADYRAF